MNKETSSIDTLRQNYQMFVRNKKLLAEYGVHDLFLEIAGEMNVRDNGNLWIGKSAFLGIPDVSVVYTNLHRLGGGKSCLTVMSMFDGEKFVVRGKNVFLDSPLVELVPRDTRMREAIEKAFIYPMADFIPYA